MIVQPVDVPIVRDGALKITDETLAAIYTKHIRDGRQLSHPGLPADEGGQKMARDENQRLRMSELFYVTGYMMTLAQTAARSLPAFRLVPEDLPSESGFMYFETPIFEYVSEDGTPTSIVAVTWGPWYGAPKPMLWLTWWSDTHRHVTEAVSRGRMLPEHGNLLRANFPILADNESQIEFSEIEKVKDRIFKERATDDEMFIWGVQIMRTIWTLLDQPLASSRPVAPSRADRRRLARQGITSPQVRVISLRRPVVQYDEPDDTSEGRLYYHQWIVRGHWRQQWHSSRGEHRPIWIAPHIKGPDGAPLLGGEKVYALRR